MATSQGTVNWYEQDALLAIDNASDDLVTRLAFLVEGYAKVRARVDTGFMRNAIYTIPAVGDIKDKGPESGEFESKKTGEMVRRDRADQTPSIPRHSAAVHAAAEYTIYREMEDHFLYDALREVQKDTPGVIQGVARHL